MAADLVLLNGFTQTGRSWQPVRHALAARYRALAPDLPGHGALAERRPGSFAACDAYLRVLAEDPIVLAGYSMGGRIALHAALSLGARVRRLVLIGASPGIADPAERAARAAANGAPGLAAALRGLGTGVMPSLWERLAELEPPVELVVGERDVKFRAIAERMEPLLRDARLHVVAGAGHAVHLE